MSNSDLKQAQEWAEVASSMSATDRARAAIKVIKSLPDQWVDIKEVQEVIEEMKDPWGPPKTTDLERGADMATEAWRRRLETLITPKLPTLADMTEEEREACRWMQCRVTGLAGTPVLSKVGNGSSLVLTSEGDNLTSPNDRITPLQGEPKLKWPGSEPAALPRGMRLADHPEYGRVVVSPGVDDDGDYKAYYSDPGSLHRATWKYADKSDLTFLDGEE